jgi:hypothetical protein
MNTVPHWAHAGAAIAAPSRPPRSRFPHRVVAAVFVMFVVVIAHQLYFATETRARVIRAALIHAAAATAKLPATESGDEVATALHRYFPDRDATIDPSRFPAEVDVTVRNLSQRSCLDAERVARRIEGKVVVQLDGYDEASACGARNVMTWRILP